MSIFSRISDIISANLNDMVEGMENPEKMLRQAVREMETTIDRAKASTAKAMASRKLLARELDTNSRQVSLWADRAKAAIADDNDDLARKAIARKQEHEKLVVALKEEIAESDQTIQRLRHQLHAMQAKLAEARRRLAVFSARNRLANLRTKVTEVSNSCSSDCNAFAKFDRMRERVEMAEAQADAMRELTTDTSVVTEPVLDTQSQAGDAEVDAELAELKKKAKSSGS